MYNHAAWVTRNIVAAREAWNILESDNTNATQLALQLKCIGLNETRVMMEKGT